MKPLNIKSTYFIIFFILSTLILFLFISHRAALTATSGTAAVQNPPPRLHRDIKIRPGFSSYETYLQHQLNKTLNPKLRKIWRTRDWARKIRVFTRFFEDLKKENLLSNGSKSLCIGARMGQEVEALKWVGVSDSMGMDLVAALPLVVAGDFHRQPFDDETFDFEFSNVFDHALYPERFVGEIERTLKGGGVSVLHVAISTRSDKYSANDLSSIEPLRELFRGSELVRVRAVDGFGLDTEVVFRKKRGSSKTKLLSLSLENNS